MPSVDTSLGHSTAADSSDAETADERPPSCEATSSGPSSVPRTIGRYVILGVLGSGGMGRVYEAYDAKLERRLALKVLHATRFAAQNTGGCVQGRVDDRAQLRLLREGRAMARLEHENVVPVYDVGQDHGRLYLAMELMSGGSLRDWMSTHQSDFAWRRRLAIIIAAGRGLAAAHAAGMTHRDFKPDNVLLGAHGEVCVTDFGLVRSNDRVHAPGRLQSEQGVSADGVDLQTRVGSQVGTPAYMSPEQLDGREADPKSDQFSFCATAYEMLFGSRPFVAEDRRALRVNIAAQHLNASHVHHRIPGWIRQALLIGLREDPDRRFASLSDLLILLETRSARAKRLPALVVGGLAVALAGLTAWASMSSSSEPCPVPAARWAGVWDDAVRSDIGQSFRQTRRAHAAESLERISHQLDRYADQWRHLHVETCRATRVSQQQSPSDLDLAMACLQGRFNAVAALVRHLRDADAQIVDRSSLAVLALPQIEDCRDLPRLRSGVPLPSDPIERREHARLRAELAEVHSLYALGRYDSGLVRGLELLEVVQLSNAQSVLAELLFRIGHLHSRLGDGESAVQYHERAQVHAIAAGLDEFAARTTVDLIYERGYLLRDLQGAHELQPLAHAQVAATGHPPDLVGWLLQYRAMLAMLEGDLEAAERESWASLEFARKGRDIGSHPTESAALGNLAIVVAARGRISSASQLTQRALEIDIEILGAEHPHLAHGYGNLAAMQWQAGRVAAALGNAERAVEICVANLGHGGLACSLRASNLAQFERTVGAVESARLRLESLAEQQARAKQRGHPVVAWASSNLASLERERGRLQVAQAWAELSELSTRSELRAPAWLRISAAVEIGLIDLERGRLRAASAQLESAREILDAAVVRDPFVAAYVRSAFAELALARDRPEVAIDQLAPTFAVLSGIVGRRHVQLAELRLVLARAFKREDRLADALHHAEDALFTIERAFGAGTHVSWPYTAQLAEIAIAQGDVAQGLAYANESLSAFDSAQVDVSRLAGVWCSVGRARMALATTQLDLELARQWLELAQRGYESWEAPPIRRLAALERELTRLRKSS